MSAREEMLGRIRGAVGKGRAADAARTVDARLAAHDANLIPARGQLAPDAKIDLFETMAREGPSALRASPKTSPSVSRPRARS